MIHGTLGETSKQIDYTLDSFKGPVKVLRRDQFYLGAEACQREKKKLPGREDILGSVLTQAQSCGSMQEQWRLL